MLPGIYVVRWATITALIMNPPVVQNLFTGVYVVFEAGGVTITKGVLLRLECLHSMYSTACSRACKAGMCLEQ